ncbi:MAG: hypothetical protein KDB03_11885 [Planctomycetales bacterium]|nr:hypothetical protein [Planctomycetales bacterium]
MGESNFIFWRGLAVLTLTALGPNFVAAAHLPVQTARSLEESACRLHTVVEQYLCDRRVESSVHSLENAACELVSALTRNDREATLCRFNEVVSCYDRTVIAVEIASRNSFPHYHGTIVGGHARATNSLVIEALACTARLIEEMNAQLSGCEPIHSFDQHGHGNSRRPDMAGHWSQLNQPPQLGMGVGGRHFGDPVAPFQPPSIYNGTIHNGTFHNGTAFNNSSRGQGQDLGRAILGAILSDLFR